ncbi:MAG: DUF4190 domain-containing protein [Collinsella sp.]
MEIEQPKQPRSGLAIAGLVLGIIALVTSLMPIINNMSFFAALVGAVLAIVGLVCPHARQTRGEGRLAIAAIAVNVISVVAVIASQGMYSAAIDDAMNGPQAVRESQAEDALDDDVGSPGPMSLSVRRSCRLARPSELSNGMTISVDEIVPVSANYDAARP